MALGDDVSGANQRLSQIRIGLQAQIRSLLERINTEDGRAVRDELGNADRIRSQVLEVLRSSGAPVVLTVGEQAAMQAVKTALGGKAPGRSRNVDPVSISTRAQAEATVRAVAAAVLDDIVPIWANAADEIRKAIDKGLTGQPLSRVMSEVADRLDITIGQSNVLIEAAIRAAYQRATILEAEAGAQGTGEPMGYLYDGPDDAKKRPFCRAVIGRVYTLEAIRRLDNGQGLPVETYRGGYNCRHRLSPITLEDARAEGYEIVGAPQVPTPNLEAVG